MLHGAKEIETDFFTFQYQSENTCLCVICFHSFSRYPKQSFVFLSIRKNPCSEYLYEKPSSGRGCGGQVSLTLCSESLLLKQCFIRIFCHLQFKLQSTELNIWRVQNAK